MYTKASITSSYATPAHHSRTGIQNAIARASQRTGVDFSYLMEKANVESSMNPNAKAKSSTATGLYQFIETTWLQMVRDHGAKYGLGQYAKCIDGDCNVTNPRTRQEILNLRTDPQTAAYMAAEYAAQNADVLKSRLQGVTDIGETELYMAHFLGPNGATKFLQALHETPDAVGKSLFPREARTNHGVFFDPATGKPRTLQQIYSFFDNKFEPDSNVATAPAAHSNPTAAPTPLDIWVQDDQIAYLEPEITDALLQSPAKMLSAPAPDITASLDLATPFPIPRETPPPAAPLTHTELLLMAQLERHRDNARYNS